MRIVFPCPSGWAARRNLAFHAATVYNKKADFAGKTGKNAKGGKQNAAFLDGQALLSRKYPLPHTRSDGRRSPEEVIALYREAGL